MTAADDAPWRRFFGTPVQFNAEMTTLVYRESDALLPFAGASRRLKEILADRAAETVQAMPDSNDLIARVRRLVDGSLDRGEPSLGQIAHHLGLSERTLRRRLKTDGSGFRELVDDTRRERALALLERSTLNVSELAHRCGFSDGAAFARAFKRWTGVSPATAMRAARNH